MRARLLRTCPGSPVASLLQSFNHRSSFLGSHLHIAPRRQGTEWRAIQRGVELEAKIELLERKLAEREATPAALYAAVKKRDETIAVLQHEVLELRHALQVAQSRIWQPQTQEQRQPLAPAADAVPLVE